MRWWILGGALAGLALAIAAGGFAEAEERLRLELEADRLWCTAGTLIVVQWEVSGGVEPYEVAVQGEERAAAAARLDCPELAAGADGALPPYGEMTVRGEAADAEGRRAAASARVLIARKLEAPAGLRLAYWNPRFSVMWDPVAGVGSLAGTEDCGRNSLPCGPYLLRYRSLGADEWTYERAPPGWGRISWERNPQGIEEMQIAAMRHPIEAQRPEGLNWSGVTRYTATREFGVIVLSAVADRIDLQWAGIEAEAATLELSGPGGAITRDYSPDPEEYWRDTHYERFEQLEPDSEYRLRITTAAGESFEVPVRTAPWPESGPAPMRLELSAGRGSCTAGTETEIDWQVTGGRGPYRVEISGAAGEGEMGAVRIECGSAAGGGVLGYAPRTVRGSAVDADGATAAASLELLAGPPLPPPRLEAPKTSRRGFYVPFFVQASRVEWPDWQVAMRWREQGESEWRYSVDDLANGPWGETGWANGSVSAAGYLPEATVFETQAARLRDEREIERPEALVWSGIALVTTAAGPVGIVAESTHDSISLNWGPAVDGLNYIATLHPRPLGEEEQPDTRFGFGQMGRAVESAPPYGIAWSGLCPGTTYFAAVRSDAASGGEWDAPVGLLIATEPDPDVGEPAPLLEASAESDRIVLRWHPDGCAAHENYRYKAYEYGTGDLVGDGYLSRDDDALVIDRLASGSSYEVRMWPDDYGAPADGEFRTTISMAERERAGSPDPPPEFSIRYVYRDGYNGPYGAFELQKHSSAGHWIELEWHVDGRRVRRFFSEFVYPSADISELPAGWYEFRGRGIDDDGRATAWSEPVRAATPPLAPRIASMRYERDFLILTWNEPDEGVPIDRYVVEWRIEEGDWQRAGVGAGGWGAIASAPFMEGDGAYVRLRAVNDEFGEGEPSAQRAVPSSRRHGWTEGMDARGCGADGSGTFSFVWAFEGGVAPFRVRARPINLEWGAAGIAEIETMDREGRFEFPCADGMEGSDDDLYASVAVQIAEYRRPFEDTITIHRMRFGRSTAWYRSNTSNEQLGPAYGEMPEPGRAWQSVHATHVKWQMGQAGSAQAGQRWVVRTRTETEPEWVERELHYGSWPMLWWYVDDLEPGTRYEYAFGRYFDGGSEWSEPGVVTTLGEVTGITVAEEDDAVIVEWDAQPDAWKYAVRLRGQGRSWWLVHDAGEGARERVSFAGAAEQGPYTAEVATPPKDATGEDESTFQLYQGPH